MRRQLGIGFGFGIVLSVSLVAIAAVLNQAVPQVLSVLVGSFMSFLVNNGYLGLGLVAGAVILAAAGRARRLTQGLALVGGAWLGVLACFYAALLAVIVIFSLNPLQGP